MTSAYNRRCLVVIEAGRAPGRGHRAPVAKGYGKGQPAVPRVFDNITERLLPAIRNTLQNAQRADFCVGYFNLRGWQLIDDLIDGWPGGAEGCCRVLVGMQRLPQEEFQAAVSLISGDGIIDNQKALRLRQQMAEQFREQLMLGAPSNRDEEALRRLSAQLRAGKVAVKLFLRHPLHAKLYLLHKPHDADSPMVGYLGSSNLTLAGLMQQGELNVSVLDLRESVVVERVLDCRNHLSGVFREVTVVVATSCAATRRACRRLSTRGVRIAPCSPSVTFHHALLLVAPDLPSRD